MSYQPSEIADLIVLLALWPLIFGSLRAATRRFPASAYVALGAMVWSYVFTIAEGFVLPDLCNMLEHVGYSVAGISFVVVLVQLKKFVGSGLDR